MKFELEEYHRNIPDEELIADVKRVASELQQDFLITSQYIKFGKFSLLRGSGFVTRSLCF